MKVKNMEKRLKNVKETDATTMMAEKRSNKIWIWFLSLSLFAYVIKNIFVGADVDEGYGVMLGYRITTGDRLLSELWEPHQTSAIFTAFFIRPFLWMNGQSVDFLNIYLRVVYFMVQGMVTWLIYVTFWKCKPTLGKNTAAGLALVYFVCSPKSIFIPEYSNLHLWFLALLCLALMWYYCGQSPIKGSWWLLVAAGFALTCDVLAYPSMVLLLPFCLVGMALQKRKSFGKEALCLLLPCVISGVIFLGYVLSYLPMEELLKVIPHVLMDGSHQQSVTEKLAVYGANLGLMGVQLLGCALAAFLGAWLVRRRQVKKPCGEQTDFVSIFLLCFFVVHVLFMFYTWFTHTYNASYTRLLYLAIGITGVYCYQRTSRREKTGFYLILISAVNYGAVLLLSNWNPSLLAPYFVLGAMGGLLCWKAYFGEYANVQYQRSLPCLCAILTVSCCFGYCFRIIGGEMAPSTIFEIRGYHHDGFRKGILANYMTAYRYNSNQELWAEAIPAGSVVMYVGMSQFSYMHGDCITAVPSTISTPTYDESLLAYWEWNPERYPDVVVLESCYGDIGGAEAESFLMQWLEEEFQAKEVIDYPYMRVYKH